MRKFLIPIVLAVILPTAAHAQPDTAAFRLLAPSEEAFISVEDVLLIAKVEGFSQAKMVEIFDNGKAIGFAPLKKGVLAHRVKLSEGRHELVLSAPDIRKQNVKIFRGKQEGYRYHIERDLTSCGTCHSGAGEGEYRMSSAQEKVCLQCHDAVGIGDFIHGPVAAGSCSPCHDPHGSKDSHFLHTTGKELCMVCHSQNLSKEHIEERQNADCTKCHDPHSSAKNYHLH